jgi:hypothetical protein
MVGESKRRGSAGQVSDARRTEGRTILGNAVENKAFPQCSGADDGVQSDLVTQMRHVIPNPNQERNFVTHVEADKPTSDPGTPGGTGAASDHEYAEHARHDGE